MLTVDSADIVELAAKFDATASEFSKAFSVALRKTAKWMKSKAVKDLSPLLNIKQSVLRRRVKPLRVRKSKDGSNIAVFFGLNPVPWTSLGAKQTKSGVVAQGGRSRRGAFLARGRGAALGKKRVFERKGKGRLPILQVRENINDKSVSYISGSLVSDDEIREAFIKYLESEIKWQTRG